MTTSTKYLILILIALFFASTNEVSAKEAEQNFNTENHSFIESANYRLSISIDQQNNNHKNYYPASPFTIFPDFCFSKYPNVLYFSQLKILPQFFHRHIYLDVSILRI